MTHCHSKLFALAFALSLSSAALLLAAGCARQESPPRAAQRPVITSAPIAATPKPTTVIVSPNIRVSEDLAASCKLQFDDTSTAPKFDFDKSALDPRDTDMLSQIAVCVTDGPLAGRGLELVGRADPRGESEYNMALGSRRASSVGEALEELGVPNGRITQTSRGKLDATGTAESDWKRDRRVDILLH